MKRSGWATLIFLAFSGCTAPYGDAAFSTISQEAAARGLDARTYRAVDAMLDAAPELLVSKGLIAVGSVEDILDVNSSTPFGNIVSEMIRSRLVQRGLPVTELRVRSSVLLERTMGEMILSRDRKALMPPPAVVNIATGTYAVGSGKVFVSLKIIRVSDSRIIAAADFVSERTADVNRLLLQRPY